MDSSNRDVAALLDWLAERRGLNLKDLSLRLGRNATYLHFFVKRGTPRRLFEEDRAKLADLLGVDESSLRTGTPLFVDPRDPLIAEYAGAKPAPARAGPSTGLRDHPHPAPAPPAPDDPRLAARDAPRDVPVLGIAVAGNGDEFDFSFNGEIVDHFRRPPGIAFVRNAFAVIVNSPSMEPWISPGDPVFINPNRPARPGDRVLVELYGEGSAAGPGFVKIFQRKTPSKLILGQYSPPRDDIELPLARVKNIWRIVPWAELIGV